MIERYSRPEMAAIWTDEARYDLWLKVEVAVCEAQCELGLIPSKSLKIIQSKAGFDAERIAEIEAEVHHDVIAFLTSVAEYVGPDSRYIHLGMTSSDLLDTAFALQLVKAGRGVRSELDVLIDIIERRAKELKDMPMMGRSHGIHAEPITMGLKFAVWYDEFKRHAKRLEAAIDDIAFGKISGAVGTFAHIDPRVEEMVCAKLGLKPAPASTQIVQRDRHAHFFCTLAGLAASMEKVAVEIRHLQRTEVSEAAEAFGKGQKGSSAMPHKRNPILCENITGLARILRTNAMAALENVALWHERDISHSSVERVIAPDSTILADFMLARLSKVLGNLDVFPETMMRNIDASFGLYNSQEVMLALAKGGMTREDAYSLVQISAMRAWKEKRQFYDVLIEDGSVTDKISEDELKKLFDIKIHTRHVDMIFKRVFGK